MEGVFFSSVAILVLYSLPLVTKAAEQINTTVVCGHEIDKRLGLNRTLLCLGCRFNDWEFINETENRTSYCRQPCDLSSPNCNKNTACREISTNYSACVCSEGYALSPIGRCEDIDECDTEKSPCDKNKKCVNSLGSFRCECIDGASNCIDEGTTTTRTPNEEPNYVLIGGIIGGLILLLLLIIFLCYRYRRAKKRGKEKLRQVEKSTGKAEVESDIDQTEVKEHDLEKTGSDAPSPLNEEEGGQQMLLAEESNDIMPELNQGYQMTNENSNRISDLYSNNKIVKIKKEADDE